MSVDEGKEGGNRLFKESSANEDDCDEDPNREDVRDDGDGDESNSVIPKIGIDKGVTLPVLTSWRNHSMVMGLDPKASQANRAEDPLLTVYREYF
jgi:hypothetical protein